MRWRGADRGADDDNGEDEDRAVTDESRSSED
jgi:hypothetical protein